MRSLPRRGTRFRKVTPQLKITVILNINLIPFLIRRTLTTIRIQFRKFVFTNNLLILYDIITGFLNFLAKIFLQQLLRSLTICYGISREGSFYRDNNFVRPKRVLRAK